MQSNDILPPIDPAETKIITFDYAPLLAAGETISSASFTVSVVLGTGVASGANIIGSATIVASPTTGALASAVQQKVGAMQGGSTYQFKCLAVTTAGETLSMRANYSCARVPS